MKKWSYFLLTAIKTFLGFPGGSEGKVSACNAGDTGLIPGLGRSPGEGNGNPLQYSCLKNPMDREAWWATVHGVAKSGTRLSDFTITVYKNLFEGLRKGMILFDLYYKEGWWRVVLKKFCSVLLGGYFTGGHSGLFRQKWVNKQGSKRCFYWKRRLSRM